MLVLTRKYQEKIRIGDNITITILRMKGKAVRLGIEAPAEIPVIRGELTFEQDADNGSSEAQRVECGAAASHSGPSQRATASHRGATGNWTIDSKLVADRAAAGLEVESVKFARVPREQVAGVLPEFVTGKAPLRGLMGRQRT